MIGELSLDSEQQLAVNSAAAAVVVVAGAGSGKTEVVAQRVERILRETPNEEFRVLALSYTVRAADELRSRFKDRLGKAHRRVDTDTIHGFALSLVRQYGTRIGLPPEPEILTRDEDRAELMQSWLNDLQYPEPDEPIAAILARLDHSRARGESAPFLTEWREAMESRGALDFPGMLDAAIDLLRQSGWVEGHVQRLYDHLIVDEAQNLTPAQYQLLQLLAGNPEQPQMNVMVVGDERQSIVTFAGGDPRLISRFATEYRAQRIVLRRNYRSASAIVRVGSEVANALELPDSPEAVDYAAPGSVSVAEDSDENAEGMLIAKWVESLLSNGLDPSALAPGESGHLRPEDIAVLSRSGATLGFARDSLDRLGIECSFASTPDDWVLSNVARLAVEIIAFKAAPDHRSTQKRIETLLNIEEWDWSRPDDAFAHSESPALAQTLRADTPEEVLEVARTIENDDPDWAADLKQLDEAFDSFRTHTDVAARTFSNFRQHIARCQRGDGLSAGVRLLTIHKAQGREFRAVALIGCNEGQIPDFRAQDEADRRSELRAFYVAVTRPTRALLLTRALSRQTRYGPRPTQRSPFLDFVELGT